MDQQNLFRLLTTYIDLFEWDPVHFAIKTGTQHVTLFLGLSLIVLYFCLYQIEDFDLWAPARVLWAYAIIRALWIVEFPAMHYGGATIAFQADAGRTLVESILIPAFAIFLGERQREFLWYSLRWVMLGLLVCVWMGWKGPMLTASFNLATVALYLPFGPLWLGVLAVPTIGLNHAGTAQLMLFAQAAVWAFQKLPKKYSLPLVPAALGATLGVIYWNSHAPMFDMEGRLNRWNFTGRFMNSWLYGDHTGATHVLNWGNLLFGVGPGTFPRVSVAIDHFKHPLVIFLHNEFQQVPWEYGMIALALGLLCYARAVRESWRDDRMLPALAALAVFCFFWHPTRFFLPAVLVALVLREGLVPPLAMTVFEDLTLDGLKWRPLARSIDAYFRRFGK